MKLEDQLKSLILSRYKSVRAFSIEANVPYSTIDSILKRGIENAGVCNVLKIFKSLNLDIECIPSGQLSEYKAISIHEGLDISQEEKTIVYGYRNATDEIKDIVRGALKPYMAANKEKKERATG